MPSRVQENTSTTDVAPASLSRKVINMDYYQQTLRLGEAWLECDQRLSEFHNSSAAENATANNECEMIWDNILCWDPAPPGTVQRQPCPDYINRFDTNAFATKYCKPDGTWYRSSESNKSWTNYSECYTERSDTEIDHAERLALIQTIGYGVSLCSLVIAVLLMCCSRLKSKSNTLHVNLFLAFILRASLSFIQRLLFVNGLGLEKDVERKPDGTVGFVQEGTHWECRALYTTFIYAICASQMWIFAEGLYLHMLIYKTLSTERNGVKPYIVLGWVLPVAIVTPWILVKALLDNTLCWNYNSNQLYMLIIQAPMLATVILNFIFFLNISRVLCSRVRSSQRHMGRSKYRHLAKFILVLIPLFGVFYILVAIVFPLSHTDRFDINQMYVEQTYNAFQGFLLALLFCFLNEEVHSEMKRIWWRRRTRRRDSVATRSYVLSSYKRNSYHQRAASVNNSQILRTTARLSSSDSTEAKQEAWFTRLKLSVLQCFGRDKMVVRNFDRTTTPPADVRENSEIDRLRVDDLPVKINIKNVSNKDGKDEEAFSSG